MDAEGGVVREGVNVLLWACHNRTNQQLWLDFGNNPSYTGPDNEGYRNAVMRFTDGKHCISASSGLVQVAATAKCSTFMVRNHGLNRFTIQLPGEFGFSSQCVLAWPSLQLMTAIVNGSGVTVGKCIPSNDGPLKGVATPFSYWNVEQ